MSQPDPYADPQQQPSVVLPIISLVALFICWPVGLVLSIVSLIKYVDKHGSTAKTVSIVAVALNVVMLPMIGIMAAIAIPNFVKFQCRSKQSEAKGNLKALYVAQESYRAEWDTYVLDCGGGCNGSANQIQFTPRGAKVRYTYDVDLATREQFVATARAKPEFKAELGEDAWQIDDKNQLKQLTNGCD